MGGYASRTLMSRSFPRAGAADAEQLRARTVDDFVERLQVLLADVQLD